MALSLINQCATQLWIGNATGRWQGFIQILNIYINEFKKGFQEFSHFWATGGKHE
jgi:hypothetical protein